MNDLGPIEQRRRGGGEPFHAEGQPVDFDLLSFWRWSCSDILSNATRGVIAEYLVAQALGIATETVREEWAAWDLTARDGTRFEVKSAAYLQSWRQKRHSRISFGVLRTRA